MTANSAQHQTLLLTVEQALQQAITYHQAGKLHDAERLYQVILQGQRNHPDAHYYLGVIAVQMNQPDAGLSHFKAALEANPNQAHYWLSYIDALMQTGHPDAARQVLAQGRLAGLSGNAVEDLAGRLKETSGSEPGPHEINTLMALFTGARFTEAAILAQTLTVRFPFNGFGWNVLGTVLKQLGRSTDALAAMQKAAALSPHDANVHSNLGVIFLDLGKLNEAETSFRRALEIEPDYAEAHSNLGNALKDLGRFDEAVASYRQALQINPDLAEAHSNLGNALKALGKHDDAVASYHRALEIKPGNADTYNNLGNALKDLSRFDEAVASYRQALQINPDLAEGHNNLGTALRELGQLDGAVTSFRQAVKLKPDFAEAYNNLGVALSDIGQFDDAVASYHQALKIKPGFADVYFNLHALLLTHANLESSIICLGKAVEIDPSNANFNLFLGIMLDYTGNQEAAESHFDLVEKNANLYRAQLDAWRYLKSSNVTLPQMTGNNIQAFQMGIAASDIDGLVMEFGVRFGKSIRQIAKLVDQEVHGFDSFEGLPEQWHDEPKGSYSTKGVIPDVPDNVFLHAGWFEDTLPMFLKEHSSSVRFMNIDCDIYSSTKTILDLLADRIVPGTVIVFDEYIGNEFWREDEFKAFQEAVVKNNWNYEYLSFSFFTKQVVIRIKQVH